MASLSAGIDDSGKAERRNPPSVVATPNYRSTYSISIGSPLSSLAGTPRRLASCELDAELVTNAASASRTSSADTFLLARPSLLEQSAVRGGRSTRDRA